MPNIRWRIGLFVFLAVLVLQLLLDVFVLARLNSVHSKEVDLLLAESLLEVQALVGAQDLGRAWEMSWQHSSKWNEFFVEIRASSGERVWASANVPAAGLGPPLDAELLKARGGFEYAVWDVVHPRSHKGHVKIRVAQARSGPDAAYTVRVARTLKRYQKTYWRLREQLAWSILGISVFAAAAASWVARRSLRPIDAMVRQAARLGRSLEGEMPRSGSNDELDRLAGVLNAMLHRIRTEMQRVHRFTSDAAHALRTPITALRGQLELLLKGASTEDSTRAVLALEVVDELTVLVNRLLLLERIESSSNSGELVRQVVRLDELVAQLIDVMAVVAEEHGIELTTSLEPTLICADARALREAILNIIDNAFRHTPRGGWVHVRVSSSEIWGALSVEDSGPGLREDQLERVFERFYSERDGSAGSGLGLSIAQAVAHAHGGLMRASSPQGALFVMYLPLQPGGPTDTCVDPKDAAQ